MKRIDKMLTARQKVTVILAIIQLSYAVVDEGSPKICSFFCNFGPMGSKQLALDPFPSRI